MGILNKVQKEQKDWAKKNFPDGGIKKRVPGGEALHGVMEELGELAHAHLKETQGIRLNEDHEAEAKDAIGDIVIYLADYCNKRGFDLEEIVDSTWREVKQRDWTKNNENGKVVTNQIELPL